MQKNFSQNTTVMINRSECLTWIAEIPKKPSSTSKADGLEVEELCSEQL